MVIKKKILITAGPTWVGIDQVRVISNLATGETGCLLAEKFKKQGDKVTLLLGPGIFTKVAPGIRLKRFKYFAQLARLLNQELKIGNYAVIIHTAAVADYQPKKMIQGKVSSALKNWRIDLVPTAKLINGLKKYQPALFTVGFKFQPAACKNRLIAQGRALLESANLDLVVANSVKNNGYQAYILDGLNQYGPFLNKIKMVDYLLKIISHKRKR